ncbi:aminomethyl-transferring glycine dehydrogenase subunit GcvPA [Candidatus Methanodesulfokora washburnensis]|uniref:Aminomethyl-transferring glycine dehydrogenase subunit GcvPA n=1 Tax=Candidatus Methanodesulfokora washburnensis TaxID=2478471 RepID=A0A429GT12_9CREN|nr:aminomethyl-transferring glycine dehydrogenase subunit GcvPA [Candidatus Methanodesulfokores washburnensis]RSN76909.1 aminomethyl-transferring glycine dehydrogenase subunit GcvPA [Candidatus Methanodesulfokores washburnensis]
MSHPYIPNSVERVKREMLSYIGVSSIEELYASIPEEIRFRGKMNLPEPLKSEYELYRHMREILSRNITCEDYLCFKGGGTWPHYVPAICDEIAGRAEFLTAYAGDPYEDHGRWQALFEFESLMAELVDMDVVTVPIYSWGHAAGTAMRMAHRINGRREVIIPRTISPERFLVINNYVDPALKLIKVDYDRETGMIDLEDLKRKISRETAAVYLENPSYLGFIETGGKEICEIAHDSGAICIVGVDPSSLGVLEPPSHYGADITVGDLQPLGIHMNFGGGLGGFLATRDEEKFIREIPYRMFGLAKTVKEVEYGFGDVLFERTSFEKREKAKEFVGTAAASHGIIAAVYLSLLGPKGIRELGEAILQRSMYAMKVLSSIDGVKAPKFRAPHFKEFVVEFPERKSVEEINKELLKEGIFGGIDLRKHFPELGNSALYCFTEVHMKEDIDKLADALKRILG